MTRRNKNSRRNQQTFIAILVAASFALIGTIAVIKSKAITYDRFYATMYVSARGYAGPDPYSNPDQDGTILDNSIGAGQKTVCYQKLGDTASYSGHHNWWWLYLPWYRAWVNAVYFQGGVDYGKIPGVPTYTQYKDAGMNCPSKPYYIN